MQPGATLSLGRKDRHVRRSVIRLGANASRHRVAFSIEEALRLLHLPGEDEGRIYHFRRLSVVSVPAEASRAVWIERMQETLATQAKRALHGADPRSHSSDAVYFNNDDEALELILRSCLHSDTKPAWFWPAALGVPAESHSVPNTATVLERIREQRSPRHTAAIILAALDQSNPTQLLSSVPTFTLRDWIRSLEASGVVLAEARPLQLSPGTVGMLKAATQHFGWNDSRVLWLAAQVALSAAPSSQSSAVSIEMARATLRSLKSTHAPDTVYYTQKNRFDAHRSIVFKIDDDISEPALQPRVQPQLTATNLDPMRVDAQPQASPIVLPLPLGERSQFAGLYFLLQVLRRLGIVKTLEACPVLVEMNLVARIIRSLATHAGVASSDPILCAVNVASEQVPIELPIEARDLLPSGFGTTLPRHANTDFLVRVWTIAVRRWCWRMGAISARQIITRSGRIWLTHNDLDVTFLLSTTDIRIRRIGLDVDPGWLPWLGKFGLVVRFHYQDRDSGGNAC